MAGYLPVPGVSANLSNASIAARMALTSKGGGACADVIRHMHKNANADTLSLITVCVMRPAPLLQRYPEELDSRGRQRRYKVQLRPCLHGLIDLNEILRVGDSV